MKGLNQVLLEAVSEIASAVYAMPDDVPAAVRAGEWDRERDAACIAKRAALRRRLLAVIGAIIQAEA